MIQWKLALWTASLVCHQIDAGTTREQLKELEYFQGRWQVTGSVGSEKFEGEIVWRWVNQGNFLLHTLVIPSRKAEYLEIVGWDPERRTIACWGFGTYGGNGKFLWRKTTDGWTEELVGRWVAWDGTRLVQNRSIRRLDENRYVFEETVIPDGGPPNDATVMRLEAKRISVP